MDELHKAVQNNDLTKLKSLIEKGRDLNERKSVKGISLYDPLDIACLLGKVEAVKLILQYVDLNYVNQSNQFGETAIHLAARNGNVEILKALKNAHADLNKKNDKLRTALFYAAESNALEAVKFLLEENDNEFAFCKDHEGKTAFDIAVIKRNKVIINYFKEYSEKFDNVRTSLDDKKITPDKVQTLLTERFNFSTSSPAFIYSSNEEERKESPNLLKM